MTDYSVCDFSMYDICDEASQYPNSSDDEEDLYLRYKATTKVKNEKLFFNRIKSVFTDLNRGEQYDQFLSILKLKDRKEDYDQLHTLLNNDESSLIANNLALCLARSRKSMSTALKIINALMDHNWSPFNYVNVILCDGDYIYVTELNKFDELTSMMSAMQHNSGLPVFTNLIRNAEYSREMQTERQKEIQE